MNFASPIFLFAFLPLVLIAYHLLRPIRAKNVLLIAAGLVFYAFGDLRHLPLLLASCALHYGVGLALMRARRGRRLLLAACVTVDLAVLAASRFTRFRQSAILWMFPARRRAARAASGGRCNI